MQNQPWPSTEMMKLGKANPATRRALVELAPCPLTRSWGQEWFNLKDANRAFSIGFPSGCRLESLKAKLRDNHQIVARAARRNWYALSLAINIFVKTTA